MELVFDEIWRALGYLLIAAVVLFAWKTAHQNAVGGRRNQVLWKGLLWCGGLALFAAFTLGNPTCEEQADPVYGGCAEYADNGFEPAADQRAARFAYLMTLLYIPVAIGAFQGAQLASRS